MMPYGFKRPQIVLGPLTPVDKVVFTVLGLCTFTVFGIVFVQIAWAGLQRIFGAK